MYTRPKTIKDLKKAYNKAVNKFRESEVKMGYCPICNRDSLEVI